MTVAVTPQRNRLTLGRLQGAVNSRDGAPGGSERMPRQEEDDRSGGGELSEMLESGERDFPPHFSNVILSETKLGVS